MKPKDSAQCGALSQREEEGCVHGLVGCHTFGLKFVEASFVSVTKSMDLHTLTES